MPRADYLSEFRRPEAQGRKRNGRPRRVDMDPDRVHRLTDEQIVAALNATDGIINTAAQKLGVTYSAVQQRVSVSPQLRKIIAMYRERSMDFTETHLRKANREGEQWAIQANLKYLGHLRGFHEKTQQEVSGSLSLTVSTINELGDEELDALIARVDRRLRQTEESTGAAT